MSNLFDPRAAQSSEGFSPNVDNSVKPAHVTKPQNVLWFALYIFIAPAIFDMVFRNQFNRMQNEINENASLIQIQLAKRADTLTKLVEQVRSYKDFEKETYAEVAKLRNLTSQTSAVENGAEIERLNNSVFGRLMAVAENYPELKASSLYKDLMENTAYLEREIAASRRLYNSKVTEFNKLLFTFPRNSVASRMKLTTFPLFAASEKQLADVSMDRLN